MEQLLCGGFTTLWIGLTGVNVPWGCPRGYAGPHRGSSNAPPRSPRGRSVSDGLTNAEIGYALGISAQTVKNHVTSILRKLAVNDRTQAVVTALRRGWLTLDGGGGDDGPLHA